MHGPPAELKMEGRWRWMEGGVQVPLLPPLPGFLPGPRNFQGLDSFLLPRHENQSQLQSHSPDEAGPPRRLCQGDSGSF